MSPGLVYDMGHDDYFTFLCALGYTTEEIQVFEQSMFTCPPQVRVEDMNLPSFVALFNAQGLASRSPVTFTRFLTSVTSGVNNYTANVVQPRDSKFLSTLPPFLSILHSSCKG